MHMNSRIPTESPPDIVGKSGDGFKYMNCAAVTAKNVTSPLTFVAADIKYNRVSIKVIFQP